MKKQSSAAWRAKLRDALAGCSDAAVIVEGISERLPQIMQEANDAEWKDPGAYTFWRQPAVQVEAPPSRRRKTNPSQSYVAGRWAATHSTEIGWPKSKLDQLERIARSLEALASEDATGALADAVRRLRSFKASVTRASDPSRDVSPRGRKPDVMRAATLMLLAEAFYQLKKKPTRSVGGPFYMVAETVLGSVPHDSDLKFGIHQAERWGQMEKRKGSKEERALRLATLKAEFFGRLKPTS